jgi:rod shape-determining protein MreD
MNRTFNTFSLFIFLLFLQVFILNNILFLDAINPYLYIAFVFIYPLKENRFPFLFYSFLLGMFIDFFSNSGGIHAFSILSIAYLRLFFVKIYFKKVVADYAFFNLKLEPFGKVFNYIVTLTLIHHFIFFSLTNFSIENFSEVLLKTIFSGVFTLLLYFLGTYIFMNNK